MFPSSWTPARALGPRSPISSPFPQGRCLAAFCQPRSPHSLQRGMGSSLITASARSRLPTPLCSATSQNILYKAKSHLQMQMHLC